MDETQSVPCRPPCMVGVRSCVDHANAGTAFRAGGTRTCIHTPGAAYGALEMTRERIASILQVFASCVCMHVR
jgi:hypothetical protein